MNGTKINIKSGRESGMKKEYKTVWVVWANGKDWEFESRPAAKYWANEQNGSTPRKIKRAQ